MSNRFLVGDFLVLFREIQVGIFDVSFEEDSKVKGISA